MYIMGNLDSAIFFFILANYIILLHNYQIKEHNKVYRLKLYIKI